MAGAGPVHPEGEEIVKTGYFLHQRQREWLRQRAYELGAGTTASAVLRKILDDAIAASSPPPAAAASAGSREAP